MTRALIIGVSGQDGAYLARHLLEKGYQVFGTSRDHEIATFSNLAQLGIRDAVTLSSMVASDFRSVLSTLQATEPDEIYNLAGQTSVGMSFTYPMETFESILTGTMNLLECIRLLQTRVRFYNAGSSEVFGNTLQPADEGTPFSPRSPYATAKAAAHYAVANYREAYGLFACTGILFNHESPLRPPRFVTRKVVSTAVRISRGSEKQLSLGNIDIARDWGWAPDYVDAMWRMIQQPEADDFVVATGESHTLREFVEAVFEKLGLEARQYIQTDESLRRPSDIDRSAGNPQKAREILGWEATQRFHALVSLLVEAEMEKTS